MGVRHAFKDSGVLGDAVERRLPGFIAERMDLHLELANTTTKTLRKLATPSLDAHSFTADD